MFPFSYPLKKICNPTISLKIVNLMFPFPTFYIECSKSHYYNKYNEKNIIKQYEIKWNIVYKSNKNY